MMLEIKNLTLCRGGKKILTQCDLIAKAGETRGVIGRNGCGKTTLIHALCRLHAFDVGSIYLQGEHTTSISAKRFARLVGILFQEYSRSFKQTLWEYCLAGRFPYQSLFSSENSKDRLIVEKALGEMALLEIKDKNIQSLSGGEFRRLCLAALICQTPDVYLLDEPTNHLDLNYQIQILNYFKAQARLNKLVIMSLHDINLVQHYCTHVVAMLGDGAWEAELKEYKCILRMWV